jgi:hypothetical protein
MFKSFKLTWKDGSVTEGFAAFWILFMLSPFIVLKALKGEVDIHRSR